MDLAAYLNAASKRLGLPVQPAHYDEVLAAFEVLAGQGALVTEFELPEDIEAAPRFTP